MFTTGEPVSLAARGKSMSNMRGRHRMIGIDALRSSNIFDTFTRYLLNSGIESKATLQIYAFFSNFNHYYSKKFEFEVFFVRSC